MLRAPGWVVPVFNSDESYLATQAEVINEGGRLYEDATDLVARYAASEIGLAAAAGDARFEVPFAWDWDGIPVHGQIDLLTRTRDGAWCVVDFKTDREISAEHLDRYRRQVAVYAAAIAKATGEAASATLVRV